MEVRNNRREVADNRDISDTRDDAGGEPNVPAASENRNQRSSHAGSLFDILRVLAIPLVICVGVVVWHPESSANNMPNELSLALKKLAPELRPLFEVLSIGQQFSMNMTEFNLTEIVELASWLDSEVENILSDFLIDPGLQNQEDLLNFVREHKNQTKHVKDLFRELRRKSAAIIGDFISWSGGIENGDFERLENDLDSIVKNVKSLGEFLLTVGRQVDELEKQGGNIREMVSRMLGDEKRVSNERGNFFFLAIIWGDQDQGQESRIKNLEKFKSFLSSRKEILSKMESILDDVTITLERHQKPLRFWNNRILKFTDFEKHRIQVEISSMKESKEKFGIEAGVPRTLDSIA